MPDKLTDAEIVKEFETLIQCANFVNSDYVTSPFEVKYIVSAIDLINRQKAEIERLEIYHRENPLELALLADELTEKLKTAKAEAYKEFVNKIKVHAYYIDFPKEHRVVDEDDIDNILKELEGENK